MSNSLPIVIQSIVYRKRANILEVLVLKRNEERGAFWSVVNGTLELSESIVDCRTRELQEETGIHDVLRWGDELNRFTFTYKDNPIVVLVYSAEVAADQPVVLNDEHVEYEWLQVEAAIARVKFDDDKRGLQKFLTVITNND